MLNPVKQLDSEQFIGNASSFVAPSSHAESRTTNH
jgi:hypothetical protein